MSRGGKSSLAVALAVFVAWSHLPVAAAAPADPASQSEKRTAAQTQARQLDDRAAANLLSSEGRLHGDPLLFIDAAAALERVAEAERDSEAATTCGAHAAVALDMLYFLDTTADSPTWQPLMEMDLRGAIERGEELATSCRALVDAIATEAAAPPPPPPDEGEKKKKGKGTGFLIGGGVALGVGVVGLSLGTAGLVIGARAQDDVTDPTIVDADDHADAERRGRLGNALSYAGFIVGAVGVGAGVALLVVGLKRRKAAGGDEAQAHRPLLLPTGTGVVLTGRF